MIRILVTVYLIIHGLAHIVGFIVPFRLANLPDAPYKTTIMFGTIDLGDTGIRIVGVLWLIAAIAFFYLGIGLFFETSNWMLQTLFITVFSMVLCILGLPDAKIGIPANIVILIFLLISSYYSWLD